MSHAFPQRIVCLTEEPTEVLYAIGEADRIVGISGFTVRPARARRGSRLHNPSEEVRPDHNNPPRTPRIRCGCNKTRPTK